MPKVRVEVPSGVVTVYLPDETIRVEIPDGAVTAYVGVPSAGATLGDLSKYTLGGLSGWTLGQLEDFA